MTPESIAPTPLPIDDVLPDLVAALREHGAAVLRAPTGAGKTTRVPPALLDAGLAGDGLVIVLEPRRVAARAAARRMAEERGGDVGGEIGYAVRLDRKASRATRILVVTDGVFLRRILDDPLLEGVGAVVIDEFHERRLDVDLALALVRRVREDVRSDLRVVAMSATLETAPLAAYLDAPVIESEGRLFPVDVQYLERADDRRLHAIVADGVRRALRTTDGDVLAFLPGVGEIRSTGGLLADLTDVDVLELYGDLPPERQDAALLPGDRRRVVLATNVAETSVTVAGVTAVVDSGRARVLSFDAGVGLDRLSLVRISKASAEQRAGRAGRTAAGICLRLWTRNEEDRMPARHEPEVRRLDLAGSVLQLLAWGETDPAAFPWFEAPESSRLEMACALLELLGATRDGRITPVGRTMARLPLPPRLARILVEGHRLGPYERTAYAVAMLSERDPLRRGATTAVPSPHTESDVLDRLSRISWDQHGLHGGAVHWVKRVQRQLARQIQAVAGPSPAQQVGAYDGNPDDDVMQALLAGFPDRLARRRAPGDDRGVLVSGRGVRLARESVVREAELFVCVQLDLGGHGQRTDALVRMASAVRREWLDAERISTEEALTFDPERQSVRGTRRTTYDGLVLDEVDVGAPKGPDVAAVLAAAAAEQLDVALALDDAAVVALRARAACLAEWRPDLELPALDDEALRALLPSLCAGCRSFADLRKRPLADALRAALGWQAKAALDLEAPERLEVPSGSHIRLQYEPGRAPVLAVRIQEVFGLRETPRVAGGRVPVLLHLLAPNGRPEQVTDDLPSFWANTYSRVRADLRRRYPKHAWPEDPLAAQPERRPRRRKR